MSPQNVAGLLALLATSLGLIVIFGVPRTSPGTSNAIRFGCILICIAVLSYLVTP